MTTITPSLRPASAVPPSRWARLWPLALIVIAALAAYHNTFSVPFLFDDEASIRDNPAIRHLWGGGDQPSPLDASGMTTSGRPVVRFSLAVNYVATGTQVWSYHAVNLVIHLLAGLALFGLVRRTLALQAGAQACGALMPGRDQPSPGFGVAGKIAPLQSDATLLALIIALLWTLHPLQTEAVTYIVQRAESLMGLFYLLTLYCFIRGASATQEEIVGAQACCALPTGTALAASRAPLPTHSPPDNVGSHERKPKTRARIWYALSVVACLLGMASKEVMVSAPVIVLLYDRTFVTGSLREAWKRRRRLYLWLAVTWLPLALLVASTGGNRGGTSGLNVGVPWWWYWLTQFEAVVRYLWLSVWPHPLVFEYGSFWVQSFGQVAPYAAVVLALMGATVVALRRWPVPGFFGAAFFAILAPTSVVAGTNQMIVEHRMYLPLAAVVTLVVLGLGRWTGRRGLVAGLAVAAGMGGLTDARNQIYGSEQSIWADSVAKRPAGARAQNNLGKALLAAGRPQEALPHLEESLRINPRWPTTQYNLALTLARLGRAREALPHFQTAVQLNPAFVAARIRLGLTLLEAGRVTEALPQLEEAVRLRPDLAEAHGNLGNALEKAGRDAEAVGEFEEALRLKPEEAEYHFNLALTLAAMGRGPDALAHYEQTVRLNPAHAEARLDLGIALAQAGRLAEALPQLEEGVRLRPDLPEMHGNLGIAFAQAGRLAEAIGRYNEALRLKPDYAVAHYNLGNALVEMGRLPEARRHFAEAVRLQPGMQPAREMLERLPELPAGAPAEP
jgi:tetratricopeptide (TPR) repeat protein